MTESVVLGHTSGSTCKCRSCHIALLDFCHILHISLYWQQTQLHIPCSGLFDAKKEQQRLQKQQAKLEKELQGLQSRLKNPKFVQNAKPEVVKEVQQAADEGIQKLAQVQQKMQQIAHLL